MKKLKLVFSMVILLSIIVQAQDVSISPYSGIGIGEIKFDQNVVLSGMGYTSTTASSEFGSEANFFNPAANRNLAYTAFGATVGSNIVKFKADNGLNSDRSNTYLTEMFIAFPLSTKTKFGVGFQPYSAVGYDVANTYSELDPVTKVQLSGNGGLNSLHSFVSYNVNENISIGLRSNFLFGNITKDQKVGIEGAPLISDYNRYIKLNGLLLTPGIMFTKKLKDNKYFNAGATYSFGTHLNPNLTYLQTTYYYNGGNEKVNIDTVNYYRGKSDGALGSEFTFGLSFNKELKYRFAVEGRINQKPDYAFDNQFYTLQNGYKMGFGGWIIPNINSYKSYLQRVVYRFGTYYEKGVININETEINQFGITFGFGFPVGKKGFRDPSMINVSMDFGRQGTAENGLIKEDFAKLKIGLNFNESWFKRRKYN